jgi:hypothetical protein
MRMWPLLFLWHPTTDQCRPGVLRLISQIASGRRGICILELWGKLTFRSNLRYHAPGEKNWLREEDCLEDITRVKRFQNLIGQK